MKVYRIDYQTPHQGTQILWVGSRVDAAQACKQIVESGDCSPGGEP